MPGEWRAARFGSACGLACSSACRDVQSTRVGAPFVTLQCTLAVLQYSSTPVLHREAQIRRPPGAPVLAAHFLLFCLLHATPVHFLCLFCSSVFLLFICRKQTSQHPMAEWHMQMQFGEM